ncbi:hypothetical protein RHMOL_Rhmol02G0275800 [Rhododendron molle]|uniref:Uncharacterized protein n=1 Tax=Rhododendron molle TaxID=49168 RepID=A0ACC0PXK1_RHOML|nr:hypothetical protein RHMOL_Rhmol02G0275800 [Rhododendron molle]
MRILEECYCMCIPRSVAFKEESKERDVDALRGENELIQEMKSLKMVKMCTYGSLWCIWILVLWATLASGQGSWNSTSMKQTLRGSRSGSGSSFNMLDSKATGQSDSDPTVRYAVTSLCKGKEYEFSPPAIMSFTMIASPNG